MFVFVCCFGLYVVVNVLFVLDVVSCGVVLFVLVCFVFVVVRWCLVLFGVVWCVWFVCCCVLCVVVGALTFVVGLCYVWLYVFMFG